MRTPHVKIRGPVGKANWDVETSILAEGIRVTVGKKIADAMKNITEDDDFTKTLTDSITYRTKENSGRVKVDDYKINAPDDPRAVDIGSGAPHAWYREHGAGVHKNREGTTSFIANMRGWVAEKIGINTNANASPQEKSIFWAIVNSIRYGPKAKTGTQGKKPFADPVKPLLIPTFIDVSNRAITAMWQKLDKRFKT